MPAIAPSILAADFARLAEQVGQVAAAGAQVIHFDVMDGHFVPNLTFGPPLIAALRRHFPELFFDVHLMVTDPGWVAAEAIAAGASQVSVHPESTPHLQRVLARIRELGARAGAALNPSTPLGVLEDVLDDLDHVLVMSVNPGFGSQQFLPHTLAKLQRSRALLPPQVTIGVDGGINQHTAPQVLSAGAGLLIAGSAVFGPDPGRAFRDLAKVVAQAPVKPSGKAP
ncbi:MAG: ribulose-phosphate 3-epimerase [Deinococcus sp.]|nr:ribulose-phosphate 3-epimerase [Deinococcus sp.]